MKFMVVDSKGGGLGRQIVSSLRKQIEDAEIIAVGTNVMATMAMQKAGADIAVTGENAVAVNARKVDFILGPIGIVIADSIDGEITPRIALSVARSDARRILLPINQCNNYIVGVDSDLSMNAVIDKAIQAIRELVD